MPAHREHNASRRAGACCGGEGQDRGVRPRSGSRRGHLTARFGAAPANVGAALHQLVVAKPFAVFRTGLADLRAHLAGARVMSGSHEHEARARVADFRARHQHSDVLRLGVFAAQLQTVADGFEADLLTAPTAVDTLLHPVTHLMWHRQLPRGRVRSVACSPPTHARVCAAGESASEVPDCYSISPRMFWLS